MSGSLAVSSQAQVEGSRLALDDIALSEIGQMESVSSVPALSGGMLRKAVLLEWS